MSIETQVFTALKTLVTNRCYPVMAPEGTALPYIVYQRASAQRENTLDHSVRLSNAQIAVDYYAVSRDAARTLADLGMTAMSASSLANDLVDDSELYDPETRVYFISATYSCWETET